jgi:acyl CoA:acetate/3-ketoacid CoA transferase beta subunit
MTEYTLVELCVAACADVWRGDGEILASGIGPVPQAAAALAKLTFNPDLLLTDGEAYLLARPMPLRSEAEAPREIEGWLPYRQVFDVVWSGRRHVMMGASQIDVYGNQNISCIGDWQQPRVQLIGVRGAPGNTANHATSYWIPNHSPRVFVSRVDMVSGVGYDHVAQLSTAARPRHEIRRVITNLGVLDFETPDHRMRLRSIHPGVGVEQLQAATGFPLAIPDKVPQTSAPTDEQLHLIRELIDPHATTSRELRA